MRIAPKIEFDSERREPTDDLTFERDGRRIYVEIGQGGMQRPRRIGMMLEEFNAVAIALLVGAPDV